jgi:hypothetical protein
MTLIKSPICLRRDFFPWYALALNSSSRSPLISLEAFFGVILYFLVDLGFWEENHLLLVVSLPAHGFASGILWGNLAGVNHNALASF